MKKFTKSVIIAFITIIIMILSYNLIYSSIKKSVKNKPKQHFIVTWQANNNNKAVLTGNTDFNVDILTTVTFDEIRNYVVSNRNDILSPNNIVILNCIKLDQ